jgi:hypothetical protein
MSALGLVYQPPTAEWPTARSWVGVKSYSVLAGSGPLLTPECSSLREIEEQVEALSEELDAILSEARARFGAKGQGS